MLTEVPFSGSGNKEESRLVGAGGHLALCGTLDLGVGVGHANGDIYEAVGNASLDRCRKQEFRSRQSWTVVEAMGVDELTRGVHGAGREERA